MKLWLPYALVALAVVLSATLSAIDRSMAPEAWAAVGLLVGLAMKRPGDREPGQ